VVSVPNLTHDGLESVLKGPVAEVDHLATRDAVILAVMKIGVRERVVSRKAQSLRTPSQR
jgi:hypothetical protein